MTQRTGSPTYTDWLWHNWNAIGLTLALLLALTWFWTVAEIPALGLLIAAVILAGGGLGLLPRRILRGSGHTTLPGRMAPLLIAHWWCSAVFLFLHVTTSARITSAIPLLEPLGAPFNERLAGTIVGWALAAYFGTLIALFVTAIARRTEQLNDALRWRRPSAVVAFLVPALLAAGSVATQFTIESQRDAAGDSVRAAKRYTDGERIALTQQRYDAAQHDVSEVRELIEPESRWASNSPFINRAQSADRTGAESYGFHLDWELDRQATPDAAGAATAHLTERGWRVVNAALSDGPNTFWADHPDGRHMSLIDSKRGAGSTLRYRSLEWWSGDDDGSLGAACPASRLSGYFSTERQPSQPAAQADTPAAQFAAAEWPAC
ncbi:hypothetical protein ACFSWE_01465 [Leucobacter albus]|uniref:Uncharacterized protein n=1 Tax=Leucobacter albus TaxID=272210 RepID=A0ABW3TQ79_9MICO